jgi:predicted MFS family arabinose efflux permease
MIAQQMHRQVLVLALAQAIFQTASVLVMTVGGLAGAQIASSSGLATLPIATMFLGTAITTFPASAWMSKVGRRSGFVLGAMLGALGGIVAAAGIWLSMLPLLALGTLLIGSYQAFAQFYRFAAGEVADDAFRARAIALVLAGGVIAAFLGPLLGRLGGPLLQPAYVGSFLILSLVSMLGATLLLGLRMPAATIDQVETTKGRPWAEVVTQPAYLVALFGAATGGGVMILAMTATPIAMAHHNHGLGDTATVIQLHVLGMFAPSFITGSLIARFGVLRVMLTGVVLLAGHIAMTLTGSGFGSFASALVLLGVGWNFLYVGGTALLTEAYTAPEKAAAQATNDMTIYVVGLVCSFSAGGLLKTLGWQSMNLALLPWLGLCALAVVGLGLRRRRMASMTRYGST